MGRAGGGGSRRSGGGAWLGVAGVRERWTTFAGTFVTLFLAVAIVSVTSQAFFSAGPRLPARLAGAAVLVAVPTIERQEGNFTPDRPWSPETAAALTERLGGIPGVARAIPDRSFYAQAVIAGEPVEAHQGYAWSAAALAPYRLASGTAPRGPGQVVLDRALGLAPGARVTVLTARGPAVHTVSGTVDAPGVYVSDAEADTLAGGVRTIGLVTAPDADVAAVEAAARAVTGGDGRVFAGEARAALEPLDDARIRWIGMQVLTAMAAMGAFVSIFVVASTFSFGVAQRRHEFGLLRAVGATPRQVRAMVYGEALVVGVAAAAAGVALGALLAPVFGDLLVEAGFEPRGFAVEPRPVPLAGSFAVGVLVALIGVGSASRRAARVSPLEALREAGADERPMPRGRWIAGLLFCAAGLAGAVLTASTGGDGLVSSGLATAMALIVGLALLGPAVVPVVVRVLTWPLGRLRGAAGMLVRESALVAVRRTASTATPVLVTVGFAVLITGMVQTTAGAFVSARTASFPVKAMVVADGVPGLSDAAVSAAGATSILTTALYKGNGDAAPTAGVSPELVARGWGRLRVLSGSLDGFGERGADNGGRGDGIAVASWVADQWGWTPGRTVRAAFEDGIDVPLRVIAVVEGGPGGVLVPRDLVRTHDRSVLADEAFVLGESAGPPPSGFGARVVDLATYRALADTEDDRLVWIFTVLLVVVSAGYTAVAIAGTLMMAAAGRLRDMTVLRLSGATTRQVLGTVAAESALVVILGTVLGLAVALPALLGMRAGLEEAMATPVALVLPGPLLLGVVGACLTIAAGAATLTTWPALRPGRAAR
ncbi:FtsX-like permease family protein [Sphaerisporangium rhizosphaerae]|uniref:FtsX-like permease family protein n=1 Tax=Sphaerisporangium rhizosphaerae TaxID=2269375 RepID=A0ABW2NUK3_9ACTN